VVEAPRKPGRYRFRRIVSRHTTRELAEAKAAQLRARAAQYVYAVEHRPR
jgi:hypothetical protein